MQQRESQVPFIFGGAAGVSSLAEMVGHRDRELVVRLHRMHGRKAGGTERERHAALAAQESLAQSIAQERGTERQSRCA